jgi:hypothetical protein
MVLRQRLAELQAEKFPSWVLRTGERRRWGPRTQQDADIHALVDLDQQPPRLRHPPTLTLLQVYPANHLHLESRLAGLEPAERLPEKAPRELLLEV